MDDNRLDVVQLSDGGSVLADDMPSGFEAAYRVQSRRLDRVITSIADISAALANTTSGVASVADAVVRVAAQHFEADWAVLILNQHVLRNIMDKLDVRHRTEVVYAAGKMGLL